MRVDTYAHAYTGRPSIRCHPITLCRSLGPAYRSPILHTCATDQIKRTSGPQTALSDFMLPGLNLDEMEEEDRKWHSDCTASFFYM